MLLQFFSAITPPTGIPTGGLNKVVGLLVSLIDIGLVIAFLLAFIFVVLSGIKWIASGGDKQATAGAKSTLTYALLGLVLVLVSFVIIKFVEAFFGISLGIQ